jgi:phosphohistidine phosphatase
MDMILWRHAEAEDIASSDQARPLTAKGKAQAGRIAKWLLKKLGEPSAWQVIASPALRTQQTAAALGLPIETSKLLAVDVSAESVFSAADWPRNKQSVIIVGHQPTLGIVAGQLINGTGSDVWIDKGNVYWFRSTMSSPLLLARASPDTVER